MEESNDCFKRAQEEIDLSINEMSRTMMQQIGTIILKDTGQESAVGGQHEEMSEFIE